MTEQSMKDICKLIEVIEEKANGIVEFLDDYCGYYDEPRNTRKIAHHNRCAFVVYNNARAILESAKRIAGLVVEEEKV